MSLIMYISVIKPCKYFGDMHAYNVVLFHDKKMQAVTLLGGDTRRVSDSRDCSRCEFEDLTPTPSLPPHVGNIGLHFTPH